MGSRVRGMEAAMGRSKNVDSWISEHDPAIRQIAEKIRGLIFETAPEVRESIKWSNPCYRGKGDIFYIAATDSYVNLGFFGGAALTDTSGRIEVTVKRMRHVKVKALEDINEAQFAAWIGEAVANDERGAG